MKSYHLVTFFVFTGLIASSTQEIFATDHDLILHYRFDQDLGNKVVDHSTYKNDGLNKLGQFLEEVRGRRGVMRFDGEKSMVQAKGASLKLKGDFTYAFWIRLNDTEKQSSCPIFGNTQHFMSLSAYIHLVFVSYKKVPDGTHQGMFWPLDRDMLGTDWSHITVVSEYPRMRFYRNGVLINDHWAPYSMESPLEESETIYLGSNGRSHGFIDLDEVAIFNRALPAPQIEALASGADPSALPRTPQTEILMEPYWYEDRLTMRLNAHHQFDLKSKNGTATVTLIMPGGHKEIRQVPCTSTRSGGTPRTVAAADFPIKQFTNKSFRTQFEIFTHDGASLGMVKKDFLLEKPAWVHNRKGHTESVPKPWTPVQVKKAEQNQEIHVWGRRYTVGNTPFYAQVTSKNAAMLAEPMAIRAMAKPAGTDTTSQPVNWEHHDTEWTRIDQTAATFIQRFAANGLNLQITGHTEYDGFTRFDCRVTANQATELSQFFLEMPVAPKHAYFGYAHNIRPPSPIEVNGTTRTDYSKMNQSGLFTESMAFPFTCEASFGDDERLLVWQAESPAGWNNQDANRAVELVKDAHTHTLRIRFIDQATVFQRNGSRTYSFALFATPSKPMRLSPWDLRIARSEPMAYDFSWPDRKFEKELSLEHIRKMQVRTVITLGACIWPYPLPLGNEWFAQQIKRNVQAFHNHGLKVLSYMIHQRFSIAAPEFAFHSRHMAVSPFKTFGVGGNPRNVPRTAHMGTIVYGVDSGGTFDACPASKALRDANVYALHKRLEYYGDDGINLDGTSGYHWLCKNKLHGCGYIDADGELQGTRPIFGVREYMKRIYVVVKSFNQDNIVEVHDSFGLNSSGLFWGDAMSTGERWHHLNKTIGGKPYVASGLPLDVARHEFTGRQHNLSLSMQTHRLGDYINIAATSLLLDIPPLPSVDGGEPWIESIDQAGDTSHHKYSGDTQVFSLICRTRDKFGAQDAQRILYYDGVEKYAVILPSAKQCYTTIFIHPSNGVLAFVTNLATTEQDIILKFNLNELGLFGKSMEVLDTMHNRKVPIREDGSVALNLKPETWTYLWLKPIP